MGFGRWMAGNGWLVGFGSGGVEEAVGVGG
jgi:hypothetical protein